MSFLSQAQRDVHTKFMWRNYWILSQSRELWNVCVCKMSHFTKSCCMMSSTTVNMYAYIPTRYCALYPAASVNVGVGIIYVLNFWILQVIHTICSSYTLHFVCLCNGQMLLSPQVNIYLLQPDKIACIYEYTLYITCVSYLYKPKGTCLCSRARARGLYQCI